MVLNSIKLGLSITWKNKKIVLLYYLANLIFSLIVIIPLYFLLSFIAGNSLMMEKMTGQLDVDLLFELLTKQSATLSSLNALFIIVSLLYWLFGLFLSGGAYTVFISDMKFSATIFWAGCAKYFGKFFRLFLWSIPIFIILYCIQFIELGIQRLFYGKDPYQNVIWWGAWIRLGMSYVGILIYYLILDYARIEAIIYDESKMRRSLWNGMKFSFQHFFKTFSLSLIIFLIGIVVLIIYSSIAYALQNTNVILILSLFIIQQVYILIRMILRLTLYSSQVKLYRAIMIRNSNSNNSDDV